MRYNPREIENKWQKQWVQRKIYEPDLKKAKRPFYNLMMFPYPSAEGLHVGNMYAFTGADIYGRFKRMQGYDVFEPIGLDGFGIHSENYAIKIGKHPAEQAKISEKNFYRQLGMLGNGFAWNEKLETYDPAYYKWTQWIFVQMFKRGLAYRKKAQVNWCPACLTVLADEQVILARRSLGEGGAGECERCETKVIKKELEQWFFKITDYAERLLKNLEKIDWSEKIKIVQRNWIGKSEGAEIDFEIKTKLNFVLLHGFRGSPGGSFFPWLKEELEKRGHKVQAPELPGSKDEDANIQTQIEYVLKKVRFDKDTVVLGHSLGSVVALKVVERLPHQVRKLILAAGFSIRPSQRVRPVRRSYEKNFDWKFDFKKIRTNISENLVYLRDSSDTVVDSREADILHNALGGKIVDFKAEEEHVCGKREPEVLRNVLDTITVFTTRPDTLFGATYMVLGPEHTLIQNLKIKIQNWNEVESYIKKAKAKTAEERIAEGKEKTGVELKGIKAINPANNEEIQIFVADYVLGSVGTGAIMAVPAHDQRDYEFARKFNLPIKMVVCPHYPAATCPVLDKAYGGEGHLVDSGKFNGMVSEKAKWEITEFVGGKRKIQYRLRDWLISRQRYWGPPIPMIYCGDCGWQPVPEKDLPVRLPYVKNFRPTGTEKSPLATVEKFYKAKCPKCKKWGRRETDVSDTFLDSAWYYLRYPSVNEKTKPWNPAITKKWFPVDMYIGGAEHAVLHLLYVRFLAMVFHDWKMLDFEEPFKKFRAHGLLIKDGAKMSKSRGNVVNPDDYIRAYGADALRMYLMFLGPFEQGGDFRDSGIAGITRFLNRVWNLGNYKLPAGAGGQITNDKQNPDLERIIHKTIKKVTEDIENLQYNTAISALMILLNNFEENRESVSREHLSAFLKLLAPFAPHISEELWGKKESIHKSAWPKYDPKLIKEDMFWLIIQVNGKVRGKIEVRVGIGEDEAKRIALGVPSVKQHISGEPKKVVFVPNRLINFVV